MNGELPLKDIKGLIEIPDYSLYFFLFLIILVLIISGTLIYFLYRIILLNKNKKLILKNLLKNITSLKLDDSKKFAYEWSRYTNQINDEFNKLKIDKHLETLEDMKVFSNSLSFYKYKPQSDEINKDTIEKFSKLREKILAISI